MARIIDGADRHYLRNPGRWACHIATLLRYSKEVNGSWFEGLRPIRRRSIRLVARALWPLGLLAYRHRRSSNIVDLPFFGANSPMDWRIFAPAEMTRIAIFGTGGMGRELADIVRADGNQAIVFVVDKAGGHG